ncbi:MAG: hypothetical protein OEZ47_12100, partial [Gammaproteobacteria bacterium]|nr:hypothetical protein [Gammaproteobacteria bacterium]
MNESTIILTRDAMNNNPLLEYKGLPPFSRISAEHAVPAVEKILSESRAQIKQLLEQNTVFTWENLVQPLEEMDERLGRAWSPVSHMNSVVNSDELRNAYNTCLPMLSEYS